MSNNTVVIALTGKGGVGKTSLCAAIVRVLTEEKKDSKIFKVPKLTFSILSKINHK